MPNGGAAQFSKSPMVETSAELRALYIQKVIDNLEVFSPDTLNIALGYVDHTGLYLPLLEILADLRETAVETGDRDLTERMHGIRRDTIEYLWRRLADLDSEAEPAPEGAWTEAQMEDSIRLRLAAEYMQGILASARIIVQNAAAGLAPRAAPDVARLRSGYGKLLSAVSSVSEGAQDLDVHLAALESALSAADLPVARSSLLAIESSIGGTGHLG